MEPQEKAATRTGGGEVTLLESLRAIAKFWRLEIGILLVGCFIAGVVSLLLPKEYEATASVLPPQESGDGRALLGALAAQPGLGSLLPGSLPSPATTKDVFLEILNSRTMQDDVIRKFDLVKVYNLEGSKAPMQSSRGKLTKMTDIRASKRGMISVTIMAYDPKVAADMANFYLENLDRLSTLITVTDAGRSRLFLERRVAEAHKALREAENRVKEYQSQSKAVVMQEQTKAAVEAAAKLEGQIVAAEVQLKAMQTFATPRHPEIIQLKESIEEMRRQLRRMEYGRTAGNPTTTPGNAAGDFSVTLGSIPSTGLELVRLIREAKIQETIFTLLTQQLEQAKIAEAKDTPSVRILDRAVVPEWSSRPNVLLNVGIAGLLSLFAGMSLALLLGYLEKKRELTGEVTSPLEGWQGGKLGNELTRR